MRGPDLLVDAFGRIRETVHAVTGELTSEELSFRVDDQANSIAWLVWHLTRIQDDHVADAAGVPQVWAHDGWADRFGLPFDPSATGFGHNSRDVAAVRVGSAELLTGYHDAVYDGTIEYVAGLPESALDRILDEAWDPPVTLGIRLVSVVADNLQHAGQAAYVRGVLERQSA